jgi:short-subunit dehydrogenase
MRYTLITGGSSGIGEQFARQSAANGENLILVSNQLSALRSVSEDIIQQYGVDVKFMEMDLSAADAAERIYAFAKELGEVDTLISNAGVLHFGKFLSTTDSYIDFITALHYTTPMKLCRLFGGDMAAKGEGKILLMCSMTAWTPFPTMSLYGSTKAALKSFAQSFWYEMREKGVSVTTVYPGAVDTPLYNLPESKRRLFRALGVMSSAESVARKGLKAMNRRRRRLIPGLFTKFVVAICAVLPAVVLLPVMKIPAIRRILDRL